jgi:hypothetical protein
MPRFAFDGRNGKHYVQGQADRQYDEKQDEILLFQAKRAMRG